MWILILYIYAGAFAKGDSVTLASVPGFSSQVACEAAAKQGDKLVAGTSKEFRYLCVKQ